MEDDDAARSLGDYESESDDDMPEPPPVDISRLMALYSAHNASFPVLPSVNAANGDAYELAAGQVDLAIPALPYHRKTYTVHSFGAVEFERMSPDAWITDSNLDAQGRTTTTSAPSSPLASCSPASLSARSTPSRHASIRAESSMAGTIPR